MCVCLCFQLLRFTLQEPLLAVSWQKEVTCSHTVALLAWLCPTRVPTACPGKGPEHGPVDLGISQNHRILTLCSWLVNQTDLGHLLLPLAGFWGRERCWVTAALKTLCGESSPAHPSLAQAVMGPNTSCSCFPCLSCPPDPSCFSSDPLFPNINSLPHL